jgi:hypothetical protein
MSENPIEILIAVRNAMHYEYLCGSYTYDESCDVYELLLGPRNLLRKEVLQ